MHQYTVAFSTAGSEAEAQTLAREMVTRGAAACVTIIPKVCSYYKWKGKLCEDTECLLMIKTQANKKAAIETLFKEKHSYDVAELILLPIEGGHQEYLDWIRSSLATEDS